MTRRAANCNPDYVLNFFFIWLYAMVMVIGKDGDDKAGESAKETVDGGKINEYAKEIVNPPEDNKQSISENGLRSEDRGDALDPPWKTSPTGGDVYIDTNNYNGGDVLGHQRYDKSNDVYNDANNYSGGDIPSCPTPLSSDVSPRGIWLPMPLSSEVSPGPIWQATFTSSDSYNSYNGDIVTYLDSSDDEEDHQHVGVSSVEDQDLGANPGLGLKLTVSQEMLNFIQEMTNNMENRKCKRRKNHQDEPDKMKAINFPAVSLRIGTFEVSSKREGDLVAKCYFAKHKLVWEILVGARKRKLEITWSDVMSIKVDLASSTLEVELNRPPSFAKETDPKPRKHTQWEDSDDFTGGQALIFRRHLVRLFPAHFEKHYEKLMETDIFKLRRGHFPIHHSPYFQRSVTDGSHMHVGHNATSITIVPRLQIRPQYSTSTSIRPPLTFHSPGNIRTPMVPYRNTHLPISGTSTNSISTHSVQPGLSPSYLGLLRPPSMNSVFPEPSLSNSRFPGNGPLLSNSKYPGHINFHGRPSLGGNFQHSQVTEDGAQWMLREALDTKPLKMESHPRSNIHSLNGLPPLDTGGMNIPGLTNQLTAYSQQGTSGMSSPGFSMQKVKYNSRNDTTNNFNRMSYSCDSGGLLSDVITMTGNKKHNVQRNGPYYINPNVATGMSRDPTEENHNVASNDPYYNNRNAAYCNNRNAASGGLSDPTRENHNAASNAPYYNNRNTPYYHNRNAASGGLLDPTGENHNISSNALYYNNHNAASGGLPESTRESHNAPSNALYHNNHNAAARRLQHPTGLMGLKEDELEDDQ